MINKKKKKKKPVESGFCDPAGPLSENQRKRKERQVLRPRQRTKRVEDHEGDHNTNLNWCTWNGLQKLKKLEIRGRIETIKTTTLLRSTRILRRVLVT